MAKCKVLTGLAVKGLNIFSYKLCFCYASTSSGQGRKLRSWGQGQVNRTKYTHADGLSSAERQSHSRMENGTTTICTVSVDHKLHAVQKNNIHVHILCKTTKYVQLVSHFPLKLQAFCTSLCELSVTPVPPSAVSRINIRTSFQYAVTNDKTVMHI